MEVLQVGRAPSKRGVNIFVVAQNLDKSSQVELKINLKKRLIIEKFIGLKELRENMERYRVC